MSMNKGAVAPLEVSPGRGRVIVALNRDARQQRAGLVEKLKGMRHNVETHDLDISCVMYSATGEFLDGVSGRPEEMSDQSGKVYHSGDDTTGTGDYDDETISAELNELPADIHHIVFVVEMQSKHTFDQVFQPTIHIEDGKTHAIQLQAGMQGPHTAFVFARFFRDGAGGWNVHYIGEYMDGANVADWVEALKVYTK